MNIKQIREIIQLFEESSLCSLSIQEEGLSLSLKRSQSLPPVQPQAAPPVAPSPALLPELQSAGPDYNRVIEVKSPVVGVFYEAPEPGAKPFVQVGEQVKKGQVLCLIEVMKQVSEVVAPQDGQVLDILTSNGSVVEYGQTLMKLC